MNKNIITPDTLETEYGVSKRIQEDLRKKRVIRYIKAGHRTILYRRADVEEFLESRTVNAIGGGAA